jgi:hypothetical protein
MMNMNDFKITARGLEPIETERKKPDKDQVEACREVLRQCKKLKSVYRHMSSYKYKHIFERYLGFYISNGAFIQAAVDEGFTVIENPPNAYFNISQKFINNLIKQTHEK